ncbi:MAG: hypothetical protein AAGI38_16150 [Bacteroidota bacterium]
MKLSKSLLSCIILICSYNLGQAHPDDYIDKDDISFEKIEVPFYQFEEYTLQAVLRMPYAGYDIDSPDAWLKVSERNVPYEVELVFTKYPEDFSRWRTNYEELFANRIDTLIKLDSAFLNPNVKWKMVLQTQCKTEAQALRYFHGFVIKYKPKKQRILKEVRSPEDLHGLMVGSYLPYDSTVIKVIDRHPEWKNMLVVMDWTGSMYQYGVQLVLWHRHNLENDTANRVSHLIFFNDGNRKRTPNKQIGKTGGIYYTSPENIGNVVRTMENVMRKGSGGDIPENDLEAVIKGISLLESYDEIILIADNKSSVRDLELLDQIEHPIHVILCGGTPENVNKDYVQIAQATGGSLQLMDQEVPLEEEKPEPDQQVVLKSESVEK